MKNFILVLLFIYIAIACFSIIFFNGTGDAGDSVYHFLFAKYAPTHPLLFFDHWAKPVYVLLASPFAQFGFTGIKIFNALISLTCIFLAYRIAVELNIKNAIVCAIVMMFAPLYYILTFSGLTEPLFALMLAAGIYFAVKGKFFNACMVISFLPYVRSEGLIIMIVFAIYFIFIKRWKFLPLLFTGSLIYSAAGYFVYHDLLWVFTKIPYARLSSTYGSGNPFHFVVQLFYVVGAPVYILFISGYFSVLVRSAKEINPEKHILIFLGFTCFFIAHSLFWYFGIFNSMGLKRVLLGTMPLIAIVSLEGFNMITEYLPEKRKLLKPALQGLILIYIVIFPFTSNPAAINFKRDMMLSPDQESAIKTADFILAKKLKGKLLFSHPYLAEALNIDPFDKNIRMDLSRDNIFNMKPGDIIIWENWFSVVESNIKKDDLDSNPEFIRLYESHVNDSGRDVIYSVYEKISRP